MLISLSAVPTNKQVAGEVDRVLREVTESVNQMASQKDNPSVSKNYYSAVGKQEALQELRDYISGRISKLTL